MSPEAAAFAGAFFLMAINQTLQVVLEIDKRGGLFTEDWHLVGMVLSERLPFGEALHVFVAIRRRLAHTDKHLP